MVSYTIDEVVNSSFYSCYGLNRNGDHRIRSGENSDDPERSKINAFKPIFSQPTPLRAERLTGILRAQACSLGPAVAGPDEAEGRARRKPVKVDIPPIIPLDFFERVQDKLTSHNSSVSTPRIIHGPTLLAGLAVCADCGLGMTRTGVRRRDRTYTCHRCAGCQRKGKCVRKGRHVPMPKLVAQVLENVKQQLFTPKRPMSMLEAMIEPRSHKDQAVADRKASFGCKARLGSGQARPAIQGDRGWDH